VKHLDRLHADIVRAGVESFDGRNAAVVAPASVSDGGGDSAASAGSGFFSSLFSTAKDTVSEAASKHLPSSSSSFSSSSSGATTTKGLYIHGGVGCGKTYLMNLFHQSLSDQCPTAIQKVHFNAFMLGIHKQMHLAKLAKHSDPLPFVIGKVVAAGKIICFDEFQVTDIADALILKRLFTGLYQHGCLLVATSNRPPRDLYKNGIQRDLFLPFIDMLEDRNDVVSMVDSETDYRLIAGLSREVGVYFIKGDESGVKDFNDVFKGVCGESDVRSMTLRTQGRNVLITETVEEKSIARINFFDLCGKSKGAADYLVIGETFETIFLQDVPVMELKDVNMVRRFITLIDCLYECECKVIILAESRPEGIFQADKDGVYDEMFAFDRTRSRLEEMGGREWMGRKRRGKVGGGGEGL
jgi:predicted ATPase